MDAETGNCNAPLHGCSHLHMLVILLCVLLPLLSVLAKMLLSCVFVGWFVCMWSSFLKKNLHICILLSGNFAQMFQNHKSEKWSF